MKFPLEFWRPGFWRGSRLHSSQHSCQFLEFLLESLQLVRISGLKGEKGCPVKFSDVRGNNIFLKKESQFCDDTGNSLPETNLKNSSRFENVHDWIMKKESNWKRDHHPKPVPFVLNIERSFQFHIRLGSIPQRAEGGVTGKGVTPIRKKRKVCSQIAKQFWKKISFFKGKKWHSLKCPLVRWTDGTRLLVAVRKDLVNTECWGAKHPSRCSQG